MNDAYIEMVVALLLIDKRAGGGYKIMIRYFDMYESYWKKVKRTLFDKFLKKVCK